MLEKIEILSILKAIGYIVSLGLFNYLQIPTMQFTVLGILMVVDFLAGVSKQFVLDPKGITSYRAWIGVMKKVWTLISIITIGLVLKGVGIDGEKYIIAFCSLLIMAEGYSIIQNVYTILTGKIIEEFDAVAFVFRKLGEMIKVTIEKSLDSKPK